MTGVQTCALPISHSSGWSAGTVTITVLDKTYNYRTSCLYIGPIAWGNWIHSAEEKGANDEMISHRNLYTLTCSGTVNASARPINF